MVSIEKPVSLRARSPLRGYRETSRASGSRLALLATQKVMWGGALRDDTKNGCVADYSKGSA